MTPASAPPEHKPYSVQQRIADLDAIIAEAEAVEPGSAWLQKAIRARIVRDQEARRPPSNADQLQALLTSGVVGTRLHRALWKDFGNASRMDVFLGVAAAVTRLQAQTALAQLDAATATVERVQT